MSSKKEKRLKNLMPPWPKGVSGNPEGREPGHKSVTAHLKELLNTKIKAPKKNEFINKGENVELSALLATVLLSSALKGKTRTINQILDRVEGKPVQTITIDEAPKAAVLDSELASRINDLKNRIKNAARTENNRIRTKK